MQFALPTKLPEEPVFETAVLNEFRLNSTDPTFDQSPYSQPSVFNFYVSDYRPSGNMFVMGGAVNGGRIYGQYPNFVSTDTANSVNTGGNGLDRGRGALIPTTSSDQYFRGLCRWFGISNANLPLILPNIGKFPSTPLGIMA